MVIKRSDKFIRRAAVYSTEVHFLLFLAIFSSAFLPKKEPLLLTDIEIAGEGEFREAMERARTSGKTDMSLVGVDNGKEAMQQQILENQRNQENQQEKDIPEMVDELKVPEEPTPEPTPPPPPPPTLPEPAPVPDAEPAATAAAESTTPRTSEVVPIETPDNEEEEGVPNDEKKGEEEEAKKKEAEETEKAKKKERKKKEEEAKKKQEQEKKKKEREKKRKEKEKAKQNRKKKLESAIKRIEKAKKKKDVRKKMLDIAEQAEKAALKKGSILGGAEGAAAASAKSSAEDGSAEGSGRGNKGNGVGAFGVGNAIEESDYELISGQIYPYWVVPSGVRDAENIIIEIHIELGDNGEVIPSSIKILDEKRYVTDQVFRAAADSARRAILQASPLSIPKEKLEMFRSITLRFNLKEALGE